MNEIAKMKKRILLVGDVPNWIIDRCCQRVIEGIPEYYIEQVYGCLTSADHLYEKAQSFRLIHFMSWGELSKFYAITERLKKEGKKIALTVRSHRYDKPWMRRFLTLCDKAMGVNLEIAQEVNGSFVPDGIDEQFKPLRKKIVGYAGKSQTYKGVSIIQGACKEFGAEFKPAFKVPFEKMNEYYNSLDCYICASIAEGSPAPVLEALACNVPVITTDVGLAKHLNVIKVERSVEGIVKGLKMLFGRDQVLPHFSWQYSLEIQRKIYDEIFGINTNC